MTCPTDTMTDHNDRPERCPGVYTASRGPLGRVATRSVHAARIATDVDVHRRTVAWIVSLPSALATDTR